MTRPRSRDAAERGEPPDRLDALVRRLTTGTATERGRLPSSLASRKALASRLAEEAVRLLRVDLDRAQRAADVLAWMAPGLGPHFVGLAKRQQGNVAFHRGHFRRALAHYGAAERQFRVEGDGRERAIVLMTAFNALARLGRYRQALAHAQQARRLFIAQGDRLRAARMDANLATLVFRQDDPRTAIRRARRALAVFERLGTAEDVAVTSINIANWLTAVQDFSAAQRIFEQTREVCARQGLHVLELETLANLAYLYAQRGEYARALATYGRVRAWALGSGHDVLATTLLLDEAELLVELNAERRAVPLAEEARDRCADQGMRYDAAKATTLLAICAARAGHEVAALEMFESARRAFAVDGHGTQAALVDLYRAVVSSRRGDLREAAALAHVAREGLDARALGAKVTLADLILSRAALAAGDLDAAERYLASARVRLRRLPSPALAYQTAFLSGEVAHRRGRRDAALTHYARAHRVLEGLWSQLGLDELRVAFLHDKAIVYESMARAVLERGRDRRAVGLAFTYVEQAKSRALADLLSRGTRPPADREASTPIRRLRSSLNACYREIDRLERGLDSTPVARIARWRERAERHEQQLAHLLYETSRRNPEAASLQGRSAVSLADVHGSLGESVLVEYFEARGQLHAFVIDRGAAAVVDLGPLAGLHDLVRLMLFNLIGPPPSHRAPPSARVVEAPLAAHLRELHHRLIRPVLPRLEVGRPVILAAHGALHRVPFAALLGDEGFFGDRHPLALTPSATVFVVSQRRPARRSRGALVLGVPDRRAPAIAAEVRTVGRCLPGAVVLVGSRASERALRTRGARCRVLHIATHGYYRDEHPMFSSIRLARTRLDVQSLYGLRFSADLVTLSGCSTGVSFIAGGDELVGLSRGLLHAGARCVQLSLWDVHDESTELYMGAFYERYAAGASPAVAAQHAAGATRARYPHPYHWAPFVTIGQAHSRAGAVPGERAGVPGDR